MALDERKGVWKSGKGKGRKTPKGRQLDDAAWAVEEYAILGQEVTLEAMMQSAIERDPALRLHLENSYRLAGIR